MSLDDELLLSIALNPADDSLRRVYADRLLARGSAWGELIHLQLLQQKNGAQRDREAELYGLAEAWLPDAVRHAIARGFSRVAFRSGGESGWELELEQTAPGRFRRGVCQTWSFGRPLESCDRTLDLEHMLKELPSGWFTHVTLRGPGWKRFRRLPCFKGAKLVRSQG